MTLCYVRHETAPGVHVDIPHEHERLDMSDQFPVTAKTIMMTAPAILEWLEGEIEDVNKMKELYTNPIKRGVFAAIAAHLENMAARFDATTMRGLDGDETAARPIPKDFPL